MKFAIHADMEVKAVALARIAVFMISTGLSVRTNLGVTPDNSLYPRKWPDTRRKENVVDVDTSHEPDSLGSSSGTLGERFSHDCGSDKH